MISCINADLTSCINANHNKVSNTFQECLHRKYHSILRVHDSISCRSVLHYTRNHYWKILTLFQSMVYKLSCNCMPLKPIISLVRSILPYMESGSDREEMEFMFDCLHGRLTNYKTRRLRKCFSKFDSQGMV